jgi:hypothetical protein
VGPRHLAAIVSVVTHDPREPVPCKRLLTPFRDLVHVTVEVQECAGARRKFQFGTEAPAPLAEKSGFLRRRLRQGSDLNLRDSAADAQQENEQTLHRK